MATGQRLVHEDIQLSRQHHQLHGRGSRGRRQKLPDDLLGQTGLFLGHRDRSQHLEKQTEGCHLNFYGKEQCHIFAFAFWSNVEA